MATGLCRLLLLLGPLPFLLTWPGLRRGRRLAERRVLLVLGPGGVLLLQVRRLGKVSRKGMHGEVVTQAVDGLTEEDMMTVSCVVRFYSTRFSS